MAAAEKERPKREVWRAAAEREAAVAMPVAGIGCQLWVATAQVARLVARSQAAIAVAEGQAFAEEAAQALALLLSLARPDF